MLGAWLIVFRETIEAGLIVGIVLAATRGVRGQVRAVGAGVTGGVLGALLLAAFAGQMGELFEGAGQELFQAFVLLAAVVMLAWHNIWMASHGRAIAREMRALGAAVGKGDRTLVALSVVVGLAVLREGSEAVLFLYGILASGGGGAAVGLGGAFGVLSGALVAVLMYRGLLVIPAGRLLSTTSWMITLLAAGMAAQAIAFLQQAGLADVLQEPLWDTSWLLSDDSVPGRLAHTLLGYTDQPNGLQLLVWIATIIAITGMSRAMRRPPPPRPAAA
jgi:high-affinity iron transporter